MDIVNLLGILIFILLLFANQISLQMPTVTALYTANKIHHHAAYCRNKLVLSCNYVDLDDFVECFMSCKCGKVELCIWFEQ